MKTVVLVTLLGIYTTQGIQTSARTSKYVEDQGYYDFDCENREAPTNVMCSANDESPIDIKSSGDHVKFDDDDVCTISVTWNYIGSEGMRVSKNDHTVKVVPIDADHKTEQEYGYGESNLKIAAWFRNPWTGDDGGKDKIANYCFDDLHFHWGLTDDEGSEHTLDGKAFPMEAHFVHFNCGDDKGGQQINSVSNILEKQTPEAIAKAKDDGLDYHELAVIGVWFEIVEENNPVIEKIIAAVEDISNCKCEEKTDDDGHSHQTCYTDEFGNTQHHGHMKVSNCFVDISRLDLRPLVDTSDGFWSYEGSLTTPPCTDNVRWFMLKKRQTIGREQIIKFRNVKGPCTGELIAPNFRPVQDNKNVEYSCGKHLKKDGDNDR